jgi:hypothetical protein
VLSVEDWAEIRRLRRAEGLSISEVARVLGVSRNTVRGRWPAMGRRGISGSRPVRWLMSSSRGSGSC